MRPAPRLPVSCRLVLQVLAGFALAALAAAPASAATSVTRVADINPGTAGSCASYVKEYDGALYFRANDLPHGNNVELWRYDGTQPSKVAEINPDPAAGSDPSYLAVLSGTLYFCATDANGKSVLWSYDGTSASQAPGSASNAALPQELYAYNGNLYFRAARFGAPSNIGIELWKFDGATQTPIDLFPGSGSSYPQHFIEYNGLLYFNACGQAGQGTELWRTDGTAVANAATIYPNNGSSPEHFAVYDGELYFSAYDGPIAEGGHGRELWRFDGTTATRVTDINTHSTYGLANPSNLTVYQDALYFAATDGTPLEGGHGVELWKYDGNTATLVADINPTTEYFPGDDFMAGSNPSWMCVLDDILYFSANDGVHGNELWAYDGNSTWMVEDIYPGQYGSDPQELTAYLGKLFFSADDGQFGAEPGEYRGGGLFMVVPEPVTLAMLGLGTAGLWLVGRRHRSAV